MVELNYIMQSWGEAFAACPTAAIWAGFVKAEQVGGLDYYAGLSIVRNLERFVKSAVKFDKLSENTRAWGYDMLREGYEGVGRSKTDSSGVHSARMSAFVSQATPKLNDQGHQCSENVRGTEAHGKGLQLQAKYIARAAKNL